MVRTKQPPPPAAVNPKDEDFDLIPTILDVVARLNSESDIQRRGATHLLPGSMSDRLEKLGFNILNRPFFLQLMQELNLLSAHGAGTATRWRVIDNKFINEFVDPGMVEAARKQVAKYNELVDSKRKSVDTIDALKAQITSLQATPAAAASTDDATVNAMAEMVAEVERLRLNVTRLEADLAKKESPSQVAAALIARFRQGQAS